MAQSFVAQNNGRLTDASFRVERATPNTTSIWVQIVTPPTADTPAQVLTETAVSASSVALQSSGGTTLTAHFDFPVTVRVTLARVGAATLSVALTGAVLLLLRASHPPAGATVLIVSLGLLRSPSEMLVLAAGVVILTVVGWAINHAARVPAPVWSARS